MHFSHTLKFTAMAFLNNWWKPTNNEQEDENSDKETMRSDKETMNSGTFLVKIKKKKIESLFQIYKAEFLCLFCQRQP